MSEDKYIDRFFAIPEEFIISNPINKSKVLINKFELSKAMNAASHSGDPSFMFIPTSYEKEDRKYEDETVEMMNKWIKDRELNLQDELKNFYADLNR